MPKPRIRIAILIAILVPLGVFTVMRENFAPFLLYRYDFNNSVRQQWPEVAALLDRDEGLRSLFIRDSFAAYQRGGWPAATMRFHALAFQYIQIYADDETTVACDEAWIAAAREMQSTPQSCHDFLMENESNPIAAYHKRIANKVCDAAMADGMRRRGQGAPRYASRTEYADLSERVMNFPTPLDAAERASVTARTGDPLQQCRAVAVIGANTASLPLDVAARFARSKYLNRYDATWSLRPADPEAKAVVAPPAGEIHCAPAGTVFTLSMENSTTGTPITWRSRGQSGWDCLMHSSVSGDGSLLGGADDSLVHRLWPLAVGRSSGPVETTEPDATRASTVYRVTEEGSYWVPWGRAHAFAIDEEVSQNGALAYVVTHYWSPEIGWKIGQRSRAVRGELPDFLAPDWQVIAEEPPRAVAGGLP